MKKTLSFAAIALATVTLLSACSVTPPKDESSVFDDTTIVEASVASEEESKLVSENGITETSSVVSEESSYEEPEAKTTPLAELPVVSEGSNLIERDVEDAYGNKYQGPYFELRSYSNSRKEGYIMQDSTELNANGAYKYLTGTFFCRKDQNEEHDIEFMIYADDELVYYSGVIKRRTRAIDFAIDINNCNIIRIISRSYESKGTKPGIILVNANVTNKFDGELTEGEEYNSNVKLTDLHVYSHTADIFAGAIEDSYGNVYKDVCTELCSWGKYGGEYDHIDSAEFVADGEYKYLSGTIFTRPQQSENFSIEFLVYADDELVYSSGSITRATKAVDFKVDIDNCDMIRIESRSTDYTSSGTNPGVFLVNAYVFND